MHQKIIIFYGIHYCATGGPKPLKLLTIAILCERNSGESLSKVGITVYETFHIDAFSTKYVLKGVSGKTVYMQVDNIA